MTTTVDTSGLARNVEPSIMFPINSAGSKFAGFIYSLLYFYSDRKVQSFPKLISYRSAVSVKQSKKRYGNDKTNNLNPGDFTKYIHEPLAFG